ncbi:MAG TPA: HAMP domain-containing sensor histidine kinase [Chitinophagaceae bacterium]|nr:HAMP domain-containing sensor histidine kinase [Chitinophagaceae bacterium]
MRFSLLDMRSATLKWIMLLLALVIGTVVAIQLLWLNKVYSFEQRQFTTNVVKTIRGLFEDIPMAEDPGVHLEALISQPEPDVFLVQTDSLPPADTLIHYLKYELLDFNVLTDCRVGMYNSFQNRYIFESYIASTGSDYIGSREIRGLPLYPSGNHYVLLNFPHRNTYILKQMNFWIISSAILFITLIGFAISMFYFYQQKFLSEIQKDFVNNFTHEFKTPLAVMKIATGVLLQDNIVQKPEKLKNYATIISNQTDHLQLQVERLLKSASGSNKEMILDKKTADLNQIIREAIDKVTPLSEDRHARIDLNLEEEPLSIYIDPSHIELAVVNLLENALKYAADPHVVVSSGKENGHYFISVKDNGVGIEKKYLGRIFQKFYRVPTGNVHDVKGFGLGLNYVKRIVDAHRGRITVNSLPGIGTEFRILLPHA